MQLAERSAITELDVKVTDMTVWHLQLPVTSRRDHGIGTVDGTFEVVIVKLTAEDGSYGYGEASPWSVFTGTPEASFAALNRYLRPFVVGKRLGDFEAVMAIAQRAVVHCTEAKAALEAAWFDLIGKALDKPVWALLGEKCRDTIPLSVSIANPDFDQDKALIDRLVDDGVRLVKLKTGFRDLAFDRMRFEYLKNEKPELTVRIDYNQGLSADDAMKQVPQMDALEPEFIEQPVRHNDFETMAKLRKMTKAPLLADESVFGPTDMCRAIREEICDGVSVKIMKSGGIMRGIEVAEIAEKSGLSGYGGDMFETGLAHLAGVHMIAACPNISLGCEFYHAKYHLEKDLLSMPFPVDDGSVVVPDAPGLGAEVNQEMLEFHALAKSSV